MLLYTGEKRLIKGKVQHREMEVTQRTYYGEDSVMDVGLRHVDDDTSEHRYYSESRNGAK